MKKIKDKIFNIKNKKLLLIIDVLILCIGITFAYFMFQSNTKDVNTDLASDALDDLQFSIHDEDKISIILTKLIFAEGTGNQEGTSIATAKLKANSTNNSATYYYYVYFKINNNDFVYSQDSDTPELILQVTDPTGATITSIDGLTYTSVTDGSGDTISGFDVTTKTGMINISKEYEISSTSSTAYTEQDWTFNLVVVNLDADQSINLGHNFNAEIILKRKEDLTLASLCEGQNTGDCIAGLDDVYYEELSLAEDDYGNERYVGGGYCTYIADGTTYYYSESSSGTCSTRYNYVRTTISDSTTTTYTNQSSCPSDTDTYTYSCTSYTGTFTGEEPSNYVSFNDEIWRIIGVFDVDDGTGTTEKRIKLVRNSNISGSFYWDYKQSSVGTSTSSYGSNDWTDSQLMMYLNTSTGYNLLTNYTKTDGLVKDSSGYIVYQEGYKPASVTTSTTSYSGTTSSFTLTSEAQSQISDALWNLGGYNTASVPTATMYEAERGTTVYSGHATEWIGKVGLMYPSDYGYATSGGSTVSRSTCLTYEMYSWKSYSDCYLNDWLYKGYYIWFLTPATNSYQGLGYKFNAGFYKMNATYMYVHPVVYLKSNIAISGGTGTYSNPYILTLT